MTIKYNIRIRWIPDEACYRGEVTFGLPCGDDNWNLDPLLRSPSSEVLGWRLKYNWGEHCEGYRQLSKVLAENESSTEVLRQCRLYVEETIPLLQSIVTKNRECFDHNQYIEEEIEI